MSFVTLSQPDIESNILRDILNLIPQASVGVDSDYGIRAAAVAAGIEGLYQYQAWIVRQIFPDVADNDIMEIHAALRKVTYKAGNIATGFIPFTGTPGSVIPVGTQTKNSAGLVFLTTAAGVLDGTGNALVPAQGLTAGAAYNLAAGTQLQLLDSPTGINSQASISSMLAGTDVETTASLLARYLSVLRDPPASGNVADYKRWALQVAGCDGAYVYPLRRGSGTTDVIITSAGGLPSAGLITSVQASIDAQRPCGVNTTSVLAPVMILQNHVIQVKLSGVNLADVTVKINAALAVYYANLIPGSTYVKSAVEAFISDILGVTDRLVSSPAANVIPNVNAGTVEWCRLGTVAVSLMP